MGTFFKSLFSEIKSDLKSEIRTESRGVTRDAVKGIKGIFKKKKDTPAQPVQQPQMIQQPVQQPVQPQKSKEELYTELQQERLLGKDFDEWNDTFERLARKYGNDMEAAFNDEEFKAMQQDAKEYYERVYMPAFQSALKVSMEEANKLNQVTKDRMETTQQHFEEYNKDGVITEEENNKMTVEGMQVFGENFKDIGEMAPEYMGKLGDVARDLSTKIGNENLAKSTSEFADKLQSSDKQQEIRDKLVNYGQANVDASQKLENYANASIPTESLNETANNIEGNFKEAADAVGMTGEDINQAIEEGKETSSKKAVEENLKKTANFKKLAESGASEEELKEAAKDSLASTVKAFASMFGGDD